MEIIQSNLFSNFPEIIFGFSTKRGLNRIEPYFFNMSKSVGDDERIVEENRAEFFSKLGIIKENVVLQKQVHGNKVTEFNSTKIYPTCDALITRNKNSGIAIGTADCTNIYLFDKKNKIIAGVHSGWKGTRLKILSRTIENLFDLGSEPNNLFAFVGPSISQKSYPVGKEVADLFDKKYLSHHDENYYLDLKLANVDMMLNKNIPRENIEVSDLCSFEGKNLHSYRREGKKSGRALGLIYLK